METMQQKISNLIVTRLNLDDVNPNEIDYEAPLFAAYDEEGIGLELDSVDSLELIVGIKQEFGVTLTDEDSASFKNINSLAECIKEKLNTGE
jgi:acyl carrier protein